MSIELMSLIFKKSKTHGNARLVLLALADGSNDDGDSYPSIARIARKANLSPNITREYLRAFKTIGVIKSSGRITEDGKQTSNNYHIYKDAIGNDALSMEVLQSVKPRSRKGKHLPSNTGDLPCNTGDPLPLSPVLPRPPVTRVRDESSIESSIEPTAYAEKVAARKRSTQKAIDTFYMADTTLTAAMQTHLRFTIVNRNTAHRNFLQWLREVEATPAQLQHFSEYWRAVDWRGQKGQMPLLMQIQEQWFAAQQWQKGNGTTNRTHTEQALMGDTPEIRRSLGFKT